MGLRINTNVASVVALRHLTQNDRLLVRSLQRLSTGLRINTAGDDPAGLVISEQLRAEINALEQAVENTTNGINLVAVADSALQEIGDLLSELSEAAIFALNTGAATPAQIAAEQFAVDNTLAAIDRIAATTRFADRNLLNGNSDFVLVSDRPDLLDNLRLRSISFAPGQPTTTLNIIVQDNPQRGRIRIAGVSSVTAGTVIRITGRRGTQDVALISGANAMAVATAINGVAGFTGVFASGTATNLDMFSEEFGSMESVRLEVLAGQIGATTALFLNDAGVLEPFATPPPFTAGGVLFDGGKDGAVQFAGQGFTGTGRSFFIRAATATFQFDLDADLLPVSGATASATFTVANTGMAFQLNEKPFPSDMIRFGLEGMYASVLGFEPMRDRILEVLQGVSGGAPPSQQIFKGGFLASLGTGRGNDLFNNPGNALEITRGAIDQVSTFRAFLGAISRQNLEPNQRQVEVHIQNLQSSLSHIRDLDFGAETANFVKRQIIMQSSISVLANANLLPQAVLPLLQT